MISDESEQALKQPIDLKTAVQTVFSYALDLGESLVPNPESLRLEEVEFLEGQNSWNITLGFDVPVQYKTNTLDILSSTAKEAYKRAYKLFEVSAETGDVKSMKIRNV